MTENKIKKISNDIDKIKGNMSNSIQVSLQETDNLESLVLKSNNLQKESLKFYKKAKKNKFKFIFLNIRCYLISFILFLSLIYIIASLICGDFSLSKC